MKWVIAIVIFFCAVSSSASPQERYLNDNKVLYEDPQEDDVLMVNTAIGYTTVLEFPEKPTMVTTGDSSLLQIEVPKNSKNVLIKALRNEGETNLFIFTPNQRFNYKVVVSSNRDVDYVIDVKEAIQIKKKVNKKLSLNQLIKMAQNYQTLKEENQINKRIFVQKDIFAQYDNSNIRLKIIEAFSNKTPHYVVLHALIHNKQSVPVELNAKLTNVYVNGQKFKPRYVLFDSPVIGSKQETDVWLVLKDTYISLDNQFVIGVGIYDKEYIF